MKNKIKIFLVDDDAVFLKSLEIEFLQHADFVIETYATGERCIKNLSQFPDVIILDYHLDGIEKNAMNGMETLDKINKACDGVLGFGKNSYQIIHFFIRLVVTFGVLLYYSPTIALVTLGLIFVSFITTFQFDKKIVELLALLQKKENSLTAKITDSLTNIFTVKILHIEKPVLHGVMRSSIADREE